MKTLIPLSDFVLEQTTNEWSATRRLSLIIGYAEFLKQPLKLEMFVACGERYQNVLDEPNFSKFEHEKDFDTYLQTYADAEKRVLFTGFSVGKFGFKDQYYVKFGDNMKAVFPFPNIRNYTIEDLIEFDIELTPSALKQIGVKE